MQNGAISFANKDTMLKNFRMLRLRDRIYIVYAILMYCAALRIFCNILSAPYTVVVALLRLLPGPAPPVHCKLTFIEEVTQRGI